MTASLVLILQVLCVSAAGNAGSLIVSASFMGQARHTGCHAKNASHPSDESFIFIVIRVIITITSIWRTTSTSRSPVVSPITAITVSTVTRRTPTSTARWPKRSSIIPPLPSLPLRLQECLHRLHLPHQASSVGEGGNCSWGVMISVTFDQPVEMSELILVESDSGRMQLWLLWQYLKENRKYSTSKVWLHLPLGILNLAPEGETSWLLH